MSNFDRKKDYFEQIDEVLPHLKALHGISIDKDLRLNIISDIHELATKQMMVDGYLIKSPTGDGNLYLTSEGIDFIAPVTTQRT